MASFFEKLGDLWDPTDTIFIGCLAISVLLMLYVLTAIHNKIRLIEYEMSNLKKDQTVLSEELEVVATSKPADQNSV